MPPNPRNIKLTVPEFMDSICHGCCSDNGKTVINPKMACPIRRNGEFCGIAVKIGEIICRRTSLENLTYFEDY
jgi:hypothetical protein